MYRIESVDRMFRVFNTGRYVDEFTSLDKAHEFIDDRISFNRDVLKKELYDQVKKEWTDEKDQKIRRHYITEMYKFMNKLIDDTEDLSSDQKKNFKKYVHNAQWYSVPKAGVS